MSVASSIPVILTGHALQSLRDSGFDLPTALGEPIDNSLEAGANQILIRLDEGKNKRSKKHVHQIVIADDGSGMSPEILQHYLQLGYSTRYMSTETIGKYGVGAKLAALSYGKKIEVWSRTKADADWLYVSFDLDDAIEAEKDGQVPVIAPPVSAEVPDYLVDVEPAGTGTIVVWSKVDRLEEGRRAEDTKQLRVEVRKELSRIFRKFIGDGIIISVDGQELLPHDPLMRMEDSWTDKILREHPWVDSDKREHFPADLICNETVKVGGSVAKVTITLAPTEAIRPRGKGNDELARKLRIPDNQGQISFVRLDREVSYTNVPRIFPRGVQDPDRYIGIEVSFRPDMDDYFGIRNVKRGVEPHGELRTKLRDLLKRYLSVARLKLDEIWGTKAREQKENHGEHGAIEDALKDADRTMPKGRVKSDESEEEKRQRLEDLARDVIGSDDDKEQDREEYLARLENLPFVIESVDFPGTSFIDVQHIGGQVVIRVNTRHRFYREMWEPLRQIAESDAGTISGDEAVRAARRTIEALTLLIVAYGKAESMHETPQEQYGQLRNYWGMFADTLMGKIKGVM